MKAVKTISDPEVLKLFGDETRRRIVFLLRAKEMTVSKIAQELNLSPQAVYHHIKKLVDGEMVEVTREVRVDHIIESYYRATAETFNFIMGKSSHNPEAAKEQIASALNALKTLGFKLQFDDKAVSKLVELQAEREQCCRTKEYEDAIENLNDVDLITKLTVQEFAMALSMSDKEFAEQEKIEEKFRQTLKSLLKK